MVSRNTERPLRFVCFTDDASGLRPEIEPLAAAADRPAALASVEGLAKDLAVGRHLADLEGDVLFLDLDLVVTGSIDAFFDFKPEETYCVIENWTQMGEGIGNTSVFRLRIGAHAEVYDRLMADPAAAVKSTRNGQTFVPRTISRMTYWPAEWCVSFKHTLMPRWPMNFVKVTAAAAGDARRLLHRPAQSRPCARRRVADEAGRWWKAPTSMCARRRGSPSTGAERRPAKGGRMSADARPHPVGRRGRRTTARRSAS